MDDDCNRVFNWNSIAIFESGRAVPTPECLGCPCCLGSPTEEYKARVVVQLNTVRIYLLSTERE